MPVANPELQKARERVAKEWDAMWKVTAAADKWLADGERRGEFATIQPAILDPLKHAIRAWRKLNGR